MAKLGTEKHPAIIRVRTEERGHELLSICNSKGWQVIIGLEPDKQDILASINC